MSEQLSRLRPMTSIEIDDKLSDIAQRLGWLRPEGRDPHKYHEDKSELLRDIGRLRESVRLGWRG
jgi:hypothetical protein